MEINGKLALLVPLSAEPFLADLSGTYCDDPQLLLEAMSKVKTERTSQAMQKRETALNRETIPYLLFLTGGAEREHTYLSQVEREYKDELQSAEEFNAKSVANFKLWIRSGNLASNYSLYMEGFDWLLNAPTRCNAVPIFCVTDGDHLSIATSEEVTKTFRHILLAIGPASRSLERGRYAALLDYLASRETTDAELAFLERIFVAIEKREYRK